MPGEGGNDGREKDAESIFKVNIVRSADLMFVWRDKTGFWLGGR